MNAEWNVVYVPEERFVHTVVTGETRPEDVRELLREQARVGREHGCRLFLIDLGGAAPAATYYELFRLPDICEEVGVSKSGRHALVAPTHTRLYRLVESVLRNRGCPIRVFEEYEDAERWLLADGPPGLP